MRRMADTAPPRRLRAIAREIVACRRCPRLVAWREQVAKIKTARHRGETYWGRPVPGFGDPRARVLLVGLAPGAHGANRTGRIFTGDSSGDFLFPALHRAGFASSPVSRRADDGMTLSGMFVAAAARCAPPDNKPLPQELASCHEYLVREWDALPDVKVVLCLGGVAHDAALRTFVTRGIALRKSAFPFAHGAEYLIRSQTVLDSYHVSRQNTNTGRLTPAMFDAVLARARVIAGL